MCLYPQNVELAIARAWERRGLWIWRVWGMENLMMELETYISLCWRIPKHQLCRWKQVTFHVIVLRFSPNCWCSACGWTWNMFPPSDEPVHWTFSPIPKKSVSK
jgi:hypothetical protein